MLSVLRRLQNAAGADIEDLVVTNGDLAYSETFAPGGFDVCALFISTGATATGTSPTIAAALQASPDNGTTWFAVSQKGAATAVATGALSVDAALTCMGDIPISESGESAGPLLRWAFTYANADNDFAAINCWLVMRKFNQRHP